MDLPQNTFKRALAEGRQQLGMWCTTDDSLTVELLAGCGYDWLLIDCEHARIDENDVPGLLQAAQPYPVATMVRPTTLDPVEIKKLLDFGALNLLIPYVQSAAEAELAVQAVNYAPAGMRGVAGITRATRFGLVDNYLARARDEIALMLQIETVTGMEQLDEILAVEGVDGIFVGPADLAASMGHPGNLTHPDVRAACVEIIRKTRAAGLPAGFLSLDDVLTAEMIAAGSLFTGVSVDADILARGARARLAEWRAKV